MFFVSSPLEQFEIVTMRPSDYHFYFLLVVCVSLAYMWDTHTAKCCLNKRLGVTPDRRFSLWAADALGFWALL
jgi:hypothetical protein